MVEKRKPSVSSPPSSKKSRSLHQQQTSNMSSINVSVTPSSAFNESTASTEDSEVFPLTLQSQDEDEEDDSSLDHFVLEDDIDNQLMMYEHDIEDFEDMMEDEDFFQDEDSYENEPRNDQLFDFDDPMCSMHLAAISTAIETYFQNLGISQDAICDPDTFTWDDLRSEIKTAMPAVPDIAIDTIFANLRQSSTFTGEYDIFDEDEDEDEDSETAILPNDPSNADFIQACYERNAMYNFGFPPLPITIDFSKMELGYCLSGNVLINGPFGIRHQLRKHYNLDLDQLLENFQELLEEDAEDHEDYLDIDDDDDYTISDQQTSTNPE